MLICLLAWIELERFESQYSVGLTLLVNVNICFDYSHEE